MSFSLCRGVSKILPKRSILDVMVLNMLLMLALSFFFFFFCLYFPASILLIFTVGNWLCESLHILLMLDCKIYKKFQGCFLLLSYLMWTFYCKYSRNSSFYFTNLFFSNRKCLICGPGNFNSKSRKPLINSVISLE